MLTSLHGHSTWWIGIVGGQLQHSQHSITEVNNLHANLRELGNSIQLTSSQATTKRTGKVPPVPRDISSVISFVGRLKVFLLKYGPRTLLYRYTTELLQALYDQQQCLALDPEWFQTKPGEIIFALLLIEQEEFSQFHDYSHAGAIINH